MTDALALLVDPAGGESRVLSATEYRPVVVREARPAGLVVGGFLGLPGRPGDKGDAGAGISLLGVYATAAELIAAHPTGAAGESYAVAGDLYVWDTDTAAWANAGAFRGPAGAPGQIRFTGAGAPPTVIVGAEPGDTYLDTTTGDIYKLV